MSGGLRPFVHWSPSQVETFKMCERKWWLNKIAGMEVPDTGDTLTGTRVHGEMEAYLKSGDAATLSEISRPALWLLDELRRRDVDVEVPLGEKDKNWKLTGKKALVVAAGLPVLGFADVMDIYSTEDGGIPPLVLDWKTTGNLKYVKTSDELRRNDQVITYAQAVLARRRLAGLTEPRDIRVQHAVLLKVRPFGLHGNFADVTPAEIAEGMESIDETVGRMVRTARATTPNDVTPTWSACSAYRGCPFQSTCKALKVVGGVATTTREPGVAGITVSLFAGIEGSTSAEPLDSLSNALASPSKPGKTMSTNPLLASLKAKQAARDAVVPEDIIARAKTNTPPPAKGTLASILAKVGVGAPKSPELSAAKAPVIATGVLPPDHAPRTNGTPVVERPPAAPPKAANDPARTERRPRSATERLAPLGWTEAQVGKMSHATMHEIIDNKYQASGPWSILADGSLKNTDDGTVSGIPGQGTKVVEAAVIPAPATEIDSDGVLREVVVVERLVEQTAPKVVEQTYTKTDLKAVEQAAPKAAKVVEAPVSAASDGLVLFIDCHPAKGYGPTRNLEDILVPHQDEVAKRNKLPHYSLVPFNEGVKQVAAHVLNEMPTGLVLVDTRLPASLVVLEVLLPRAAAVVRGRW